MREAGPWDPFKEITSALKQKHWGKALDAAIEAGQHDEGDLTNVVFFAQHPQLPWGPLDSKAKDFKKLNKQWNSILIAEVRPAIARASTDSELEVKGDLVAERDPQFSRQRGKQIQEMVSSIAAEVDINPGFLAAVLLAEVGSATHYLNPGQVSSFFTGTDDFLAQRNQLRKSVPAFVKIGFDASQNLTNINENNRTVK